MKKFILAILCLFLSSTCWAAEPVQLSRLGAAVVGAGGSGAGTPCNAANDYIGNKTVEAATNAIGADYIFCYRSAAVCAGTTSCTLKAGYAYSTGNNGSIASLCAYSDLGTAGSPDVSDLKLSCTSVDDVTNNWATGNMDTATAVTNGTNYWVCIAPKTANWSGVHVASGGLKYKACSGCADSPPATLDGTWSDGTSTGSLYITVGP